MTTDHLVRVVAIRSVGRKPLGGTIFTGREIAADGHIADASSYLVVKLTGKVQGDVAVQPGQWWRVSGVAEVRTLVVDAHRIQEVQLEATWAEMQLPSGEHIVDFLATNPDFKGIGRVKARRLWEGLGPRLYEVLDSGDLDQLERHLAPEMAAQLVEAWRVLGKSRVLQWLQSKGFDPLTGRKVVEYFGEETPEAVEEDPYRLLSFNASWQKVDALARTVFEISPEDTRRLLGAVEEACYRLLDKGHTRADRNRFSGLVAPLLEAGDAHAKCQRLVDRALSEGLTNGGYVCRPYGLQPLGALVMETEVARFIAARIGTQDRLLTEDEVDELLLEFERAERIELNAGQWDAVRLAAEHKMAVIAGGAGVGKTTVLKALHLVYERAGLQALQLALTGRAARRIAETTGRPASTIAGFLSRPQDDTSTSFEVVVVDESSMVDLTTMAKLCQRIPDDCRLVLVGDTGQLMPIGPGLVLHAVVQVPQVPKVELEAPQRFGNEIAFAARAVRQGEWPSLSNDVNAHVVFSPAISRGRNADGEVGVPETVLHLYRDDPQNTQILCATKGGPAGTKRLNELCQAAMTSEARLLTVWNEEHQAHAGTGLRLGDRVVCTRNLWARGLQNGSIGELVVIEDSPREQIDNSNGLSIGPVIAWIDWDDGVRRPVDEALLDDLELAYAITVHKAQGSQWPRVVVPAVEGRTIDRTLVYTAMTRAQRQAVFVGDEAAAREAVERTPRFKLRDIALDRILAQEISAAQR